MRFYTQMRSLREIDRFYIILAAAVVIVGGLVVYGVRGIFETLNTANRIDEEVIGDADPRLNVGKLNEAHDAVFKRQPVPLDLKN